MYLFKGNGVTHLKINITLIKTVSRMTTIQVKCTLKHMTKVYNWVENLGTEYLSIHRMKKLAEIVPKFVYFHRPFSRG